MGNLKNHNFNKIDAFLSSSQYYDFHITSDEPAYSNVNPFETIAVHFDFNDPGTFSGDSIEKIYSLETWTGATNTGYTFQTFGLTGLDNGYLTFNKPPEEYLLQEDGNVVLQENYAPLLVGDGDPTNQALLSALTGSTVVIPADENRLILTRVTGMTGNYVYPLRKQIDLLTEQEYMEFGGGFYQGYYKLDGYSYEVLPTRVPKAWVAEFVLRKGDLSSDVELLQENYYDILQEDEDNILVEAGATLNETYPENKGFFFYMGTRAENKFWNIFEGNNTGCTSGCTIETTSGSTSGCTDEITTFCTAIKETNVAISGDSGYPIRLSPPPLEIRTIENPFLIYGRAVRDNKCRVCGGETEVVEASSGETGTTSPFIITTGSTQTSGTRRCTGCGHKTDDLGTYTVCSYDGGPITVTGYTQEVVNTQNPFLIYGRAGDVSRCGEPSGLGNETVCTFSGFTKDLEELDVKADVIDNALGFRIKDDGSIGYRALKLTGYCSGDTYVTGVTVEEQYSMSGVVTDDQWQRISIRFVMPEYDECELETKGPRKGRLMFYVNCRLKFVAEEVDELVARRLNEYKDKQLGVPFNISIGGGSQGLLESMTFDGQDPDDLGLCIEENFAGTFIGDISQFKFYLGDLNWCELKTVCDDECDRYKICEGCVPAEEDFCILAEDGGTLLQENGFKILQEYPIPPQENLAVALQEDGDLLLQENGSKIIFELG